MSRLDLQKLCKRCAFCVGFCGEKKSTQHVPHTNSVGTNPGVGVMISNFGGRDSCHIWANYNDLTP